MIPYNDRIKFPQLVIQKDKYADSHYLANSLEDLLNIGWHIFKQWVENNYFDYLEGSSQPDVDLFNQEKAEKHVFRKSKKYRTLCSVALGTMVTAVVAWGGQVAQADEVVTPLLDNTVQRFYNCDYELA